MSQMVKSIFASVLFLIFIASFSYCETVNVDDLVRQYAGATEVQRSQIESANKYKVVSISGMIKDVGDWATFDERTDTGASYYKVTTELQAVKPNLSYQALIFYKDKARIESLNKGQEIKVTGAVIKIVDELGFFSVWIFADDLMDEDKVMLNSGT